MGILGVPGGCRTTPITNAALAEVQVRFCEVQYMDNSHDRLTLSYYTFNFSIGLKGIQKTYRRLADPRGRKTLLLPFGKFGSKCRNILQIGNMSK